MNIAIGIMAGLAVVAFGMFVVFSVSEWVVNRLTQMPGRWYYTPLWMAFGVAVAFPALISVFIGAVYVFGAVAGISILPWEQ